MVSFRGQKKVWATPISVSFRGLILSYADSPPPPPPHWGPIVTVFGIRIARIARSLQTLRCTFAPFQSLLLIQLV